MIGACLTTTATKWDANAARPIAVAFLPAKIGSGPNCRHAITVISPLTLPIRSQHALAENASLAGSDTAKNNATLACQKNGRRFGISHAVYQKSGEVVVKFTWNAKKFVKENLT